MKKCLMVLLAATALSSAEGRWTSMKHRGDQRLRLLSAYPEDRQNRYWVPGKWRNTREQLYLGERPYLLSDGCLLSRYKYANFRGTGPSGVICFGPSGETRWSMYGPGDSAQREVYGDWDGIEVAWVSVDRRMAFVKWDQRLVAVEVSSGKEFDPATFLENEFLNPEADPITLLRMAARLPWSPALAANLRRLLEKRPTNPGRRSRRCLR